MVARPRARRAGESATKVTLQRARDGTPPGRGNPVFRAKHRGQRTTVRWISSTPWMSQNQLKDSAPLHRLYRLLTKHPQKRPRAQPGTEAHVADPNNALVDTGALVGPGDKAG